MDVVPDRAMGGTVIARAAIGCQSESSGRNGRVWRTVRRAGQEIQQQIGAQKSNLLTLLSRPTPDQDAVGVAVSFGFILMHHPIRRIGQDKTNQDEKMNQDESR